MDPGSALIWVFLAFLAGLIGYFGKYIGRIIIRSIRGGESSDLQKKSEQKVNVPSKGKYDYKIEKEQLKLEKKKLKKEKKQNGDKKN
ncbi:MAG: hypothetical protein ABH950_05100 [Candidatus Altiarchaeota archaeon]